MSIYIKNAKLRGEKTLRNIFIDDGKIQKISPADDVPSGVDNVPAGADVIDAAGNLASPPFVDPHVHLDAVLVSGLLPRSNESGTLLEAIDIWSEWKEGLTKDIIKSNALEAAKWYAANGVLRVRTHADTTDPTLLTVESLLEVRDELKDIIDIQVVGFPQNGIYTDPANRDLLRESIRMGIDVVGGAPHIEYTHEDGVRDVETVYELAEADGKLIDIHIDETGDPNSRFIEVMVKESILRDYGARSAASHACAMHNYNNDYAFKLIGNIAKAGFSVITNPFDNSVLQNRRDGYPRHRGSTRVDELVSAGVNVAIGHDSIMDPWYSMGTGNMIAAANLLMHLAQMNGSSQIPQLFDMITVNSARLMCLDDYGIDEGKQADLVILDGRSEDEVIRLRSECLYVIRKGRVLCKTEPPKRQLYMSDKPEPVDFKL
jgi:cytosine deaminase